MNAIERWPRDRNHLGSCIQLHRARAQCDHRVRKRKILVFETLEIPQHLVFGVVAIEHGVRHEVGCTCKRHRDTAWCACKKLLSRWHSLACCVGKDGKQCLDIGDGCCFIDRDANARAIRNVAEIDLLCFSALTDSCMVCVDAECVEPCRRAKLKAKSGQTRCECACEGVYAMGDTLESVRTVVDTVHRCHVGKKCLRSADVRCCFVATDVLLACLQRHAKSKIALCIDAHSDDTSWHHALVRLTGSHKRSVGSTIPKWHTKALRTTHRNIGAELTRRRQHCKCEQICTNSDQCTGGMCTLAERCIVCYCAVAGRVLNVCAED